MSVYLLENTEATELLAGSIAKNLGPGDVVGLAGDLGSGKTFFCRALILTRLAELGRVEDIPSPSFTLVQSYDLDNTELWHADLYRLGDAGEIVELGLDDAFEEAICLVEWIDRLGSELPDRYLRLELSFVKDRDDARRLEVIHVGEGWDWVDDCLTQAGLVKI